jgi:site-specific DNA-methyltransferase (adenine-specific)
MNYQLETKNCLDGMAELQAKSVDVVITSPPSNIGFKYRTYVDSLPDDEYLRWSRRWMEQVFRVLKPKGSFFLIFGGSHRKPLLPLQVPIVATECGFHLQNRFNWIKAIAVPTEWGALTVGQLNRTPSRRFVAECHEFVFHLTPNGDTPLDKESLGVSCGDPGDVRRPGHGSGLSCRGNNWCIPYPTLGGQGAHPNPASFPKQLAMNCILIHGWRPDLFVLDPFLGTGASAFAALECSVENFVGFDIDEEYVRLARRALDETTPPMFTPEDFRRPQAAAGTPADCEVPSESSLADSE